MKINKSIVIHTSKRHKHKCLDCKKIWSHKADWCLKSYSDYPCVKCLMNPKNGHVIFLGSTPEIAKELYDNGVIYDE